MNDSSKHARGWSSVAVKGFFTDKNDRVVLWQAPNLPLYLAMAGWLLGRLTDGVGHDIGRVVFVTSLIVWAALELLKGVTHFRRVLGLAVLIATVAGIL